MKRLVFVAVFSTSLIFNLSFSKDMSNQSSQTGKKDICNLMYQTHLACRKEAKKGKFYLNADSCHIFSIKFAFFSFGKFGYSPNFAQLSETLGNICYASCIGSDKLLNTIRENCKGMITY